MTPPLRGLAGRVFGGVPSIGPSALRAARKSTYARNAGQIVIGNVIGQLISLASIPILSRLYGPSLFGEYGVFAATAGIVNGFVCLGLVSAILSPKEEEEASAVYRLCILSAVSITTLLVWACIALSPYFQVINVSGNYVLTLAMLGLFLVANNWATAAYTLGLRQKAYRLLWFNPMIASAANLLAAAWLALGGFKSYGLPAAAIISQVAVLVHLLVGLGRARSVRPSRALWSVLRKYKDFPLLQMPSNILRGAGQQLPIVMISGYFGLTFLGHYSMAQRILYVPITLVGGAMGQVHFQRASELSNSGEDIGLLTYRVVRSIMLLVFFPLLLLAAFGGVFLERLLGPEWALAGTMAQIRAMEFLFVSGMFSISYVFVIIKRQRVNLVYTIATLLLNVSVVVVAGNMSSSGLTLVVALSLCSALMNGVFIVYALYSLGVPLGRFVGLSLTGSVVIAASAAVSVMFGGTV